MQTRLLLSISAIFSLAFYFIFSIEKVEESSVALSKKNVSEIIDLVFRFCGQKETVIFCDKIKDLGL